MSNNDYLNVNLYIYIYTVLTVKNKVNIFLRIIPYLTVILAHLCH